MAQPITELEFSSTDPVALGKYFEAAFSAKYSTWEDIVNLSFGSYMSAMVRKKRDNDPSSQRCFGYFTVKDIKAEITRLEALHATVHIPPTDASGHGWWAFMTAPGGIVFGVWQSKVEKEHPTPEKKPTDEGTITYLDFVLKDQAASDKTTEFFNAAYKWGIKPGEFGNTGMAQLSDWVSIGLRLAFPNEQAPNVIPVVNVMDIAQRLKEQEKHQAKATSKVESMPNMGSYVYLEVCPASSFCLHPRRLRPPLRWACGEQHSACANGCIGVADEGSVAGNVAGEGRRRDEARERRRSFGLSGPQEGEEVN